MSNQFNLEWLETLVVRLQKHLALWTWTLWPLPSCNRPSTPKVKAHTRDNGFSFSSASGYLKHLSWITVSRPFRLHSHQALAFHLETVRSVVMLLQNVCIMIQTSLSQDDGHPKKTETMNRFFSRISLPHVVGLLPTIHPWKIMSMALTSKYISIPCCNVGYRRGLLDGY